jgi:hypothetical protein
MVIRSHVGHFRGRDASYDDSLVDHDVRRKPTDFMNLGVDPWFLMPRIDRKQAAGSIVA